MTGSRFQRLLDRVDPFDPEFVENFWEVCAELRERCPVAYSDAHGGFWTVSRFQDVMDGFGDNDALSTVPTVVIPPNPAAVPMIPLQAEPGAHREFRRLLNPYYRPSDVAPLEPAIRATVTRIIDGFVERGSCEVIGELGRPLAGDVVFRLVLGLPDSEVDEAYHWTMAIMHGHDSAEASVIYERFGALVSGLLERRQAEPRRHDVVDALLHGAILGRPLTTEEKHFTLMHQIAAGLDTTAHALGNIFIRFARDPSLPELLASDPALVPTAVEELLRIDPPAGGLVRTAARDVEIDGTKVRAGDRVLLLVAGANRDPRAFDEPESLRPDRAPNRHLAWGYGAHTCLGMHLARLELRVALEELVTRVKDVELADEHVVFDNGVSRGPASLHIRFTPGLRRSA
jgi:cytochrome P450